MIEYGLLALLPLIFLFATRLFLKYSIRRCTSKNSMKGKVIIITGANSGIGFYAAKDISQRGGRVILACRSRDRGTAARDQIIAETGNKDVIFKQLDLSSLKSVREFAADIEKSETRLDVLVNNAGVAGMADVCTEDNIVAGMQTNYFAPFLLTNLLLPMLTKSKGRIVNVSSLCHLRGEVNLDKINRAGAYLPNIMYANSKLCLCLFTKELARKLGDAVTVNSLHPGVILTNISMTIDPLTRVFFKIWCWICCRTAEEGAQTIIHLSVADEVESVTGKYFVDCEEAFVLWKVNDEQLAKNLWNYSENLVKIRS